jgi:hypothetical protein
MEIARWPARSSRRGGAHFYYVIISSSGLGPVISRLQQLVLQTIPINTPDVKCPYTKSSCIMEVQHHVLMAV